MFHIYSIIHRRVTGTLRPRTACPITSLGPRRSSPGEALCVHVCECVCVCVSCVICGFVLVLFACVRAHACKACCWTLHAFPGTVDTQQPLQSSHTLHTSQHTCTQATHTTDTTHSHPAVPSARVTARRAASAVPPGMSTRCVGGCTARGCTARGCTACDCTAQHACFVIVLSTFTTNAACNTQYVCDTQHTTLCNMQHTEQHTAQHALNNTQWGNFRGPSNLHRCAAGCQINVQPHHKCVTLHSCVLHCSAARLRAIDK